MGSTIEQKADRLRQMAEQADRIEDGRAERNAFLTQVVRSSGLTRTEVQELLSSEAKAIIGDAGMGQYRHRRRKKKQPNIGAAIKVKQSSPGDSRRYVYVIGSPGHPVKIGISANPVARLRQLQTGNSMPLQIYARVRMSAELAPLIERDCHLNLDRVRLAGEWFDIAPDEAIETVKRIVAQRQAG